MVHPPTVAHRPQPLVQAALYCWSTAFKYCNFAPKLIGPHDVIPKSVELSLGLGYRIDVESSRLSRLPYNVVRCL